MASVTIYEKDYTKSEAYSPTQTVVYIPGMAGSDCPDVAKMLGKPTLYEELTDFTSDLGTQPRVIKIISESSEVTQVEYDKSFVIAKQLVAMGMKVLYEVVMKADGAAVSTKEEMVARLGESDFWQRLRDRSLYNPRFITSGGYSAVQGESRQAEPIAVSMIELAHMSKDGEKVTGRGDCVALIDAPAEVTDVKVLYSLFNVDPESTVQPWTASLQDGYGTFGTCIAPWCNFGLTVDLGEADSNKDTTDKTIDGYWKLPGSFAYLLAYNAMLNNYDTWYAASGVSRGAVPLLVSPIIEMGEIASNSLQPREEGAIAINPICKVNPYGYRIYGNRTLRQNIGGLKAQSFLNIRNLCSDIKKVCFQACKLMAFEQNTDILWTNLKSQITPILEKMMTGQGIEGYEIKRISTKEKAKVVGKIRIIPIEAVEDFELTLELADSLSLETESE